MNRETLIVPEKKEKIEKIKRQYNNMQMSDDVAKKISRYEIANKILKAAATAVGIVTVVDLIIPDPVLGLDEAALSAITALLTTGSIFVDNKIDDLAKEGDTSIKMDEVTKLTNQMSNAAKNIKMSQQNRVRQ